MWQGRVGASFVVPTLQPQSPVKEILWPKLKHMRMSAHVALKLESPAETPLDLTLK